MPTRFFAHHSYNLLLFILYMISICSSARPLWDIVKSALNVLGLGAAVRDIRYRSKHLFDAETRHRNARFKGHSAPDGLPMPPPKLIYLVSGQVDAEAFYHNGVIGAGCIRDTLNRHGLDMNAFGKILDFGCGCGRVMRQWKTLTVPRLYGTDCNPRLIDWCRRNLPIADFGVNKAGTPLSFADGTFDFIYSISEFTHLIESSQRFWMDEVMRVLKPGGHLLLTVHGVSRLNELSPEQRQAFEAGSLVIVGSQYSGTNSCGTYHPQQYVRNVLCRDWRLLAFEPGGAKDANQDAFLMQKLR